MPKAALRTIIIVYAVLLGLAYLAEHPPGWTEGIALRGGGHHTFRVLGHRITLRVEVDRAEGAREPPVRWASPIPPQFTDSAAAWSAPPHAGGSAPRAPAGGGRR